MEGKEGVRVEGGITVGGDGWWWRGKEVKKK
jgi:hypothetical protein